MNPLNFILDPYDRNARLYPALLLVLPVVITIVTLFSSKLNYLQGILGILLGSGSAFLLTQLTRDAGKRKELELFEKWGGMPSVVILRHSDHHLDPITKTRYHKKLARLVNDTYVPTHEQEREDTANVNAVYTTWSNYLRTKTRDTKKFHLLFNENINYGFRRNSYGIKIFGIIASLICTFIIFGFILYHASKTNINLDQSFFLAMGISLGFNIFWIFVCKKSWVYTPALAYAMRLLESIEVLNLEKKEDVL